MNITIKQHTDFSEQLPLIGREEEINLFETYLNNYSAKNYLYFVAEGGIGKTRLLQEFLNIVRTYSEKGKNFRFTEIMDLFHTDIHSTSDIERIIIESIDPEDDYFKTYRKKRYLYTEWREMGADPSALEKRRQELSQIFIHEWNEKMADNFHKIVLLFDTLEQLQFESSVVEDLAELDSVEARVKPWLLNTLSRLNNVLVVFAGRPKHHSEGQLVDHQKKLEDQMAAAYKASLEIIRLAPLTEAETVGFFTTLSKGEQIEVIPGHLIPIIHCLTDGRPIFLHLIFDLIRHIHENPDQLLKEIEGYQHLLNKPRDEEKIIEAQFQVRKKILNGIFKTELGGYYLARIGMMPKGVNIDILKALLGMPEEDIEDLLNKIRPLSFVKQFSFPTGGERLHQNWIFLHDEMYQLMKLKGVIIDFQLNERSVASNLVTNYYDPNIQMLEKEIDQADHPTRITLRERIQKLQVERLYYILVQNPKLGFVEYKRLCVEANRHRWVGFSMRLLDEFMRFYNDPTNDNERREQFQKAGISHEQIVRESAELWVERFHWWGQSKRELEFTSKILSDPKKFHIRRDLDIEIMGNIYALWGHNDTMVRGYNEKTVDRMLDAYEPLFNSKYQSPKIKLARARIANALGFLHSRGGLLHQAIHYYKIAKHYFYQLDEYQSEYAILSNNLAYEYAKQGSWPEANALIIDAFNLNEDLESQYSLGLTLSTSSAIEGLKGNYDEAISDGLKALQIFQKLQDNWGVILARQNIAFAKRRKAKKKIETRRDIDEAVQSLKEAEAILESAIEASQEFQSKRTGLYVEMGRVYRELGRAASLQKRENDRENLHHTSRNYFRDALEMTGWVKIEKIDATQDFAEEFYFAGFESDAHEKLAEVESMIGSEYLIIPGEQIPNDDLPNQYFWPLGKVERLRGEIHFNNHCYEEGLRHFNIAYAYFERFSTNAAEIGSLIQYVYSRFNRLHVLDQEKIMNSITKWLTEVDLGTDTSPFITKLKGLMGD